MSAPIREAVNHMQQLILMFNKHFYGGNRCFKEYLCENWRDDGRTEC